MSAIKDQLIEHIEAYAIARTSGNAVLASLSATALNTLLDTLLIHDDASPPQAQVPQAPQTQALQPPQMQAPQAQVPQAPQTQAPQPPQIQVQAPQAPAPEAPGDGFELPLETPAPRARGRRAGG